MAPTTIASKALQQKRSRPVSQMVTPVIPLPYVHQREKQKLKAAAEALAKAKREEEEALQTPVPPPVEKISAPTPPLADAVISVANGSSDHTSSERADEISVPTSPEHVAEAIPVGKNEEEAPVLQSTYQQAYNTSFSTRSRALKLTPFRRHSRRPSLNPIGSSICRLENNLPNASCFRPCKPHQPLPTSFLKLQSPKFRLPSVPSPSTIQWPHAPRSPQHQQPRFWWLS